eukprot:TRINITY_DN2667_c1_g2_i1.p5 TRINITY_DN2667_c1_g2~~TRINITY_DN2667_c1_g2_i1.p5  ORF type:complete len:114 (+),score=21.46 TRINITY_DN2667_c1_g2_i1:353-694(+)
MPDGSFNYGMDEQFSECTLSPSAAIKCKQLGFQINSGIYQKSQLSRMGSSTESGLREIVIFEDADSNFDQRSMAAKSFASRVSELFKVDDDENDIDTDGVNQGKGVDSEIQQP